MQSGYSYFPKSSFPINTENIKNLTKLIATFVVKTKESNSV